MAEGYSGTPLAKKLGIKEGVTIHLYNQPAHYFDLFIDMPDGIIEAKEAVPESIDFIHIFCTTYEELKNVAKTYKKALKKDGMLWVSWPKGSSSIQTDLKREIIREHLIDIGLVDIKVCAVDKDWSGLKFVYRIKDR
ncbi:DUF3052 domain-containing protein [Aquimarina sp. 2201CG5-10]|uniref:DUF3052 domain-containing protein n=1 Tax=Aquimarina callyspongiae TaxID=3098150 RepID=UPI002AB505DD|nr:DUF3052 domain-containing protein [Aquimarina sp. 2201CG5-10]MDY8135797.1 DUF3052 domain-containing protein [Aquimarina sp. 2201CG5-10]